MFRKLGNFKHHMRRCWVYLGITIIFFAIIFSVFRALTPWARQYKPQVEHFLSQLVDQPVTIDSMETNWYWFQPVLRLNNISITDTNQQSLKIDKMLVGINLLSSLWHWKLQPGILYADRSLIEMTQVGDNWQVKGFNRTKQDTTFDPNSFLRILMGLSAQDKIILRHISILMHLKNGVTLPLTQLNMTIKNWGGDYRIRGRLSLVQKIPTEVSLSAELKLDADQLNKTKGRIYLAIHSLEMSQWEDFFPNGPIKLKSGHGDITVWLDIKRGQLAEGQSTLEFQNLAVQRNPQKKLQKIEKLTANLGWKKTKTGWDLEGDRINFSMNNVNWPENAFFIHHYQATDSDRIFLKHLLIKPTLSMRLPWPEAFNAILDRKPVGELYDTEFNIQKGDITYLLTGFKNLGWRSTDKIPEVQNLSGVVYWTKQSGRLELDSYDMLIKPKGLPPVTFSQINTALEWRPSQQGLRFNLENLVVQSPDLVLSAKAVLDKPNDLSTAHLNWRSQCSATNAEQWIKYLSLTGIKPKLNEWLQRNIKKISKITAETVIEGFIGDFPFDHSAGEFRIKADLNHVDLHFTPKWPLTKNVDARVMFDKRDISFDIYHAELQGITINNMNLRIDDIGLDRETLLLRGKINEQAQKMLEYVFSTPLNDHLARLRNLNLKGLLGLDLKMEVPLYPQNSEVLTHGDITLVNDQLSIQQGSSRVNLSEVNGLLSFNEKGIFPSDLKAKLNGDVPITFKIQTIHEPKPAIQIMFTGNINVATMRSIMPLPIFELMKGETKIIGGILLTHDQNDYDRLELSSNLQGMKINLPEPWGKNANANSQIKVGVGFSNHKPLEVLVDYGEKNNGIQIKGVNVEPQVWAIKVEQQNLTGNMRYSLDKSILTGELSRLHIDKMANNSSNSISGKLLPENIPETHLTIHHLSYDNIELGEASLDSNSSKNSWNINSFKVKTPEYDLQLKGKWTKNPSSNQMNVQGELITHDLKHTLARWQIKTAVEADEGSLVFDAGWPGFLSDFSLTKMGGHAEVNLKDGRITDLGKATEEKLGLGKVLSIFSLQTIPRRLKLDFSDLSKKGYTFDHFKGKFQFVRGQLTTNDSSLDGPVAAVNMKGSLDLVRRTYNLEIFVSPHIMASLPAVASMAPAVLTIGGGPIIGPILGAATWVGSKIINKVMYKVTGYTYKVTGPWQDPIVEPVKILKKRLER